MTPAQARELASIKLCAECDMRAIHLDRPPHRALHEVSGPEAGRRSCRMPRPLLEAEVMTPPSPEERAVGRKKPRIAKAQGRSVAEWIGRTPDEIPPPHVKLRVFRRFDGVCHILKRKILGGEAWDCDHVKPVEEGGENRERNLAPALASAHDAKTTKERERYAKADAVAKKHFGLHKSATPMRKHPTLKRTVSGRVVPRLSKTETTSDYS